MTEDGMAGWHHQLNGHEFEQVLGGGEGQGSWVCCSPWGSQRVGYDLATEQQQETKALETIIFLKTTMPLHMLFLPLGMHFPHPLPT